MLVYRYISFPGAEQVMNATTEHASCLHNLCCMHLGEQILTEVS